MSVWRVIWCVAIRLYLPVSGSSQHPPGMATIRCPTLASQHAVDVHRINTCADLRGLLAAGAVSDRVLIKNHHIGKISHRQNAIALQAKTGGRLALSFC